MLIDLQQSSGHKNNIGNHIHEFLPSGSFSFKHSMDYFSGRYFDPRCTILLTAFTKLIVSS